MRPVVPGWGYRTEGIGGNQMGNQMLVDIQGAFDLHVHTYPCLIPRICDDARAAIAAATAGLGGMVLKCHHESSVSRAYEVQKQLHSFHIFGGIVLNDYVGGLNPAAVEAALRTGAKAVWMPTIHSAYHARIHGSKGKYDVQEAGGSNPTGANEGITVLNANHELKPEVVEILKLVAEYNAYLGTAHLSPQEIYILTKLARNLGVQKIVITHPYFKVPRLELGQILELVEMGAIAEFGYCTVSPMWNYATIDEVVKAIKTLEVKNCVIMSDSGQRHNPMPHESLRIFAQCLFEKGLTQEDLDVLVKENPKRLLGLA